MKLACASFIICAGALFAQEFEFEEPAAPATRQEDFARLKLPVRGKIVSEVGRQIENRWVFLGPFVGLTLDYQSSWGQIFGESAFRYNAAYAIEKDSTYTREGYQFEAIPTELYWRKSFENVSISAGKIITVWGKADILPVSDVISARDATKAFFAQPQEARLGQNTVRVDWFLPKQEIQLLFIPYPVNTRYTDRDHPYALLPGVEIHKASAYGREVEGGGQYTAYLGGGAISVFGGRFYNRDPLFRLRPDYSFEAVHAPYATTGISANFPLRGMLLKFDSAYQFKRLSQTATQLPNPQCPETCGTITMPYDAKGVDQVGFTVGLDYNTTEYGSFILEYSVAGPTQKDPQLLRDDPLHSYAFGYSKNFVRDTLSFNSFVVTFLKYSNILFRFNVTYKLTDVISAYVQYTGVFIASGDPDLRIFDKYDRFDLQLSYQFDLAK
ncbi:MAG TPA: hypothetical protein PKM44_03205 [Turneriella sp.]|nr:hypothetical protein [Turneriella sp.]